eukprot:NODE_4_length_77007_cov_1.156642.p66 type:complete len:130 gc:universal NODE_4_length_77007_cov_1.156642:74569-74180(-)
MKRSANLLVNFASITKLQQEQIDCVNNWPEYTPEEPEVLEDEVSNWAIDFCKRMRELHDTEEIEIDDMMPAELIKGTISKIGATVLSSDDEDDEENENHISDNNVPTEEEDNDYIADYGDEDGDAIDGT